MIDTAVPEELLVAELRQHCRQIIEAELVRLRRVAPTLPESIMIEIDRTLGQVVDGWLLTPVRRHPERVREVSALFGLAPRPIEEVDPGLEWADDDEALRPLAASRGTRSGDHPDPGPGGPDPRVGHR